MNVFRKILGKISGENLTIGRGNTEISESREVSTTLIREIPLRQKAKKASEGQVSIKKAFLLEGLFASVENSFEEFLSTRITAIVTENRNLLRFRVPIATEQAFFVSKALGRVSLDPFLSANLSNLNYV